MNGVPNLSIIMRDDWIEMDIVSFYSGDMFQFTFYANGTVTVSENCEANKPIDVYSALSLIADISTDNIQAFEDRP